MYKPDNDNLKKFQFISDNYWTIPNIKGLIELPEKIEFVGFNYCKSLTRKAQTQYGVHFFLDDYQFNRVWHSPDKYLAILKQFVCVLSPDFSLYLDYPKAIQIYKHYQKHWLAQYWQANGIKVIPTICWSDKDSFEWCFLGEPKNSIVAVSSIGTQKSEISKRLFLNGYYEMQKQLSPKQILFWGNIPPDLDRSIIKHMGYTMDEKFKLLKTNRN